MRLGVPLIMLVAVLGAAAFSQPTVQQADRQHGGGHAKLILDATPMSAAVTQQHNAADVRFATMMIGHHRQAVQMAELAAIRAEHAELKHLAQAIITAQTSEITTMTRWLRAWDEPVPPVGAHDGDDAMPGMMSAADMGRLASARGVEFDRLFLMMMLRHHEGAIKLAITEQAGSANPDVQRLATTIQRDQQRERSQMRAWQAAWNLGARLPSTR